MPAAYRGDSCSRRDCATAERKSFVRCGINLDMREHSAASDPYRLRVDGPPRFHFGQSVWSNSRRATFIYHVPPQAAAIRYQDERHARIVPLTKIAAVPPGHSK
jgi:hypothetical protein